MSDTDTPESDEAAWFDNDEGWWVSRSVARRLERGGNCALAQVKLLEEELKSARATIVDQGRQLRAYEQTLDSHT